MFALYLITLGSSAGLVGVFVRQAMGATGYLHGFRTEMLLAAGVACAYVGVQLGFMGLLRLLKPAKSVGPILTESGSHLAALVLLPYLMHMSIPWPDPLLEKAEPAVLFGGFAVLHVFLKLATFYASLRAEPGARLMSVVWLGCAAVCVLGSGWLLKGWSQELELARPQQPSAEQTYRAGSQYAAARELPEGVIMAFEVQPAADCALTLRLAPVPDEKDPLPSKAYVSVALEGDQTVRDTYPVTLAKDGWTDVVVPSSAFPAKMQTCKVVWDIAKPPKWQRALGIRPITTSHRKVMLAGPMAHTARDASSPGRAQGSVQRQNVVVIALEGLAADHVGHLGYKRNTTPGLDKLAQSAIVFPNAYTPAPEAFAACMSMLTGLSPLRHGCLEKHRVALASNRTPVAEALVNAGYTTAAFTQGEAKDAPDMVFGSGVERGFEIFDPSYVEEAPTVEGKEAVAGSATAGSATNGTATASTAATLTAARAWLDAHVDRAHFVFIRLRELADPKWQERYAPGFASGPEAPAAVDVYDSAVLYTDHVVTDFIKHIRSGDAGKSTCVIVTSPYGLDFSPQRPLPIVGLTEKSLHVPLMVLLPDGTKEQRAGSVTIEDVAPTCTSLATLPRDFSLDGKDLAGDLSERRPIAVAGAPLAMSLRADRWRFSWQSGLRPFTWETDAPATPIELYDVFQARKTGVPQNDLAKNAELAARYTRIVDEYLRKAIAAQ